MTETQFLDGAALLLGAGLMFSGVRAIRRREVDQFKWPVTVEAEGHYEGASAVRLDWLWFVLGALFVAGVLFDVTALKVLFQIFLEASS
ncbi:hypothetical protein HW932_14920 [Allochromatium humboldtianum]|uniref:Uncharacterized protein n=1 Tax=Allochromatium humboldtianum TaxID=504901 RepID=A0A850RCG5_9GAMM|nr:hypothetical protein [Allochromatium humboldtianum]NVZ10555.1 hypothetical protein [Allochromatium humboldtianum]